MERHKYKTAVTLIEVLVVIALLAVLVTAGLGVSSYIQTQAREKLAESTISVLVTALGQYYEYWSEFPNPDPSKQNDPDCDLSCEVLCKQLYSTPNSRKICQSIQDSQVANADNDAYLEFVDPWGTALRYGYDSNDSNNFPVIESAGPDKEFGSSGDNITSKGL